MATARQLSNTASRQRWLITGASTGKQYHVDTYPSSALMRIENAETNRAVRQGSAPSLVAEIRQAIKDVQP